MADESSSLRSSENDYLRVNTGMMELQRHLEESPQLEPPLRFRQADPSRVINTVIEEIEHQSEESDMRSYYAGGIPDNMFVDMDALERRALHRNQKLSEIERLLYKDQDTPSVPKRTLNEQQQMPFIFCQSTLFEALQNQKRVK